MGLDTPFPPGEVWLPLICVELYSGPINAVF